MRITDKFKLTVNKTDLDLYTIKSKKDLINVVSSIGTKELYFLIYQFDFIVPKVLTEAYPFFNLHSGSLKFNRGAHPIIWSVLNNDSESCFSLHRINEKIDQGELIYEYPISILQSDSPQEIKQKMELGFIEIFENLQEYIEGKADVEIIKGGTYYPFIRANDFTIDIDNDSELVIRNKIRSQQAYKGAILNFKGDLYFVKSFDEYKKIIK